MPKFRVEGSFTFRVEAANFDAARSVLRLRQFGGLRVVEIDATFLAGPTCPCCGATEYQENWRNMDCLVCANCDGEFKNIADIETGEC